MHTDSASTKVNLRLVKLLENDTSDFDVQKSDAAIDMVEKLYSIKIGLYRHGGQISIPIWHTDEAIQPIIFTSVKRYVQLIQREKAYAIYDSQLGRVGEY